MNEKQRKFLRTLAHGRKPVVMVGSAGLTDAVLTEVELALDAHELVKVRIRAQDRENRDGIATEIVSRTGATQIQRIGHVLTLYRRRVTDPGITVPT